jgi:hypothetical protein
MHAGKYLPPATFPGGGFLGYYVAVGLRVVVEVLVLSYPTANENVQRSLTPY